LEIGNRIGNGDYVLMALNADGNYIGQSLHYTSNRPLTHRSQSHFPCQLANPFNNSVRGPNSNSCHLVFLGWVERRCFINLGSTQQFELWPQLVDLTTACLFFCPPLLFSFCLNTSSQVKSTVMQF